MSPSGGEQARQFAMVIGEVFREPVSEASPVEQATLLEAVQAAIEGQLAVLDDADLTGTGKSSASVLGVPGILLADRLAGHLVREIMLRGSRGGPLAPLADQLNHDLSHMEGRRLEGMLARLADEVRDVLIRSPDVVSLAAPLGRRDPDRPLRGRIALLDGLAGAWDRDLMPPEFRSCTGWADAGRPASRWS